MTRADSSRRHGRPVLRRALLGCGALLLGIALALAWVVHLDARFLDDVVEKLVDPTASEETRALQIFAHVSEWEYFEPERIRNPLRRALARFLTRSGLHLSTRAVLTAGTDQVGPCGSLSRSLLVLLPRTGIAARKLQLCDTEHRALHTVVEAKIDGEWRVLDPSYGLTWRRPSDGELATVADLARDETLFRAGASLNPQYPIGLYNYQNVYHLRWAKIPGGTVFRDAIIRMGGDEWVRQVQTPLLYERPRLLLLIVCLVAAGGCFVAGARLGAARRGG